MTQGSIRDNTNSYIYCDVVTIRISHSTLNSLGVWPNRKILNTKIGPLQHGSYTSSPTKTKIKNQEKLSSEILEKGFGYGEAHGPKSWFWLAWDWEVQIWLDSQIIAHWVIGIFFYSHCLIIFGLQYSTITIVV